MYSKSGDDVDDFVEIADGEITPTVRKWQQYTFTLPSDAKYFALWQNNHDGNSAFGIRLDDVAYEAANPVAVMDGYNLYRNGELLVSGLTDNSYVDKDVDLSGPVQYILRTTGIVNGERVESDRSNVVWAYEAGVAAVAADRSIRTQRGEIIVAGHANDRIIISDAAGRVYARGVVANDIESYNIPQGVYVVRCGVSTAKVVVK
jgi:hypothetical protein